MSETPAKYRTRKPAAPRPIAKLALIEINPRQKILAGHDSETEQIYVLRKDDQGVYGLFRIEISELDQALRSFLLAEECDDLELRKAIQSTMAKPKTRRRRSKAK